MLFEQTARQIGTIIRRASQHRHIARKFAVGEIYVRIPNNGGHVTQVKLQNFINVIYTIFNLTISFQSLVHAN